MIKICEQCSAEYKTFEKKQKYCSKQCVANSQKTINILECEYCKIKYTPKSKKCKTQRYCSQTCMGKARNKAKECICLACGGSFISKIIKGVQQCITCSVKCKNEYLKRKAGSYKICKVCNKEFYSIGNRDATYCSRECVFEGRKTGEIVNCKVCNQEVYRKNMFLQKNKNHFCGIKCADVFQGRDKVKKECKMCKKEFFLSKSTYLGRKYETKYCSLHCMKTDDEWVRNACIKGNLAQLHKKGLNKLELKGREILQNIGIADFQEQVLMFEKFCVDVLIESKKLIIQWDGTYWHSLPKRIQLDKAQDAYFKKCGYKVLRITDLDIKNNLMLVYENIKRAV